MTWKSRTATIVSTLAARVLDPESKTTMAEARDHGRLTARDREILKDVILTYILSAEPVSSRSVAKHGKLGLSAATIRNVMADLEEWGYLMQPHTSAGRVPTASAYHLFIDSMMEARAVPARERRYIQENLKGGSADADQLVGMASHLLSELSTQVGIVVTPAMGETVLKAVDFIPVSGRKVLCVVVSSTGFIDNKVIETDEEMPREELVRISNYLTESFGGQTLRQIRERLLRLMVEEKAQMDRMLARTMELAQAAASPWTRPGGGGGRDLDAAGQARARPTCSGCGGCSRPSPTRRAW